MNARIFADFGVRTAFQRLTADSKTGQKGEDLATTLPSGEWQEGPAPCPFAPETSLRFG